jgi:hypothetical protein
VASSFPFFSLREPLLDTYSAGEGLPGRVKEKAKAQGRNLGSASG